MLMKYMKNIKFINIIKKRLYCLRKNSQLFLKYKIV